MMTKYPYNDSLEAYKHEHAHQTPGEAEIEFTLIYLEWNILINEDFYYDSLDSINDDYNPVFNDRAIPFMDFIELVDVVFTANNDYLESHIDRLLEYENVVLPPFLLKYLYDNFPYKKHKLDYLVSRYESDYLLSDNALKFVRGEVSSHKPMERTLLLFEIFEFTCKNMSMGICCLKQLLIQNKSPRILFILSPILLYQIYYLFFIFFASRNKF